MVMYRYGNNKKVKRINNDKKEETEEHISFWKLIKKETIKQKTIEFWKCHL